MSLGLTEVLFLILLVLKLTHHIDWSWWWITAPLWIGAAADVVLFVLFGGIAAVVTKWVGR